MPRKRPPTPPEKRRAPKGSAVGQHLLTHTPESLVALEWLCARWQCSRAEAVRRALVEAATRARG